jgi:hypothetical protein
MNAVEHLARLDDAVRIALAQAVDGAASRPIDSGQAENLRARRAPGPERKPVLLDGDTAAPALGRRFDRHRLVDPSTLAVAVYAHRRQVADPTQRRRAFEVGRIVAQRRIAVGIRRRRDEDVRGTLQSRGHAGTR